jgi:hypothetical protein
LPRLVGAGAALGDWQPENGVLLRRLGAQEWGADVVLPAGRCAVYKYVLLHPSGAADWQPGADAVLPLHRDDAALEVVDEWGGDAQGAQLRTWDADGREVAATRHERVTSLLAALGEAMEDLDAAEAAAELALTVAAEAAA